MSQLMPVNINRHVALVVKLWEFTNAGESVLGNGIDFHSANTHRNA